MTAEDPPPSPTERLRVPLKGESASNIADLESLLIDMTAARNYARLYLAWSSPNAPTGEDADTIRQALWSACAISYRRISAKGNGHLAKQRPRLKLPENWTQHLTPELREAHEEVWEISNTHIAHQASDMQQVMVVALLNPPPEPQGVFAVSTETLHMAGPSTDLVERLIVICESLMQRTAETIDHLQGEAIKHLSEPVRLAEMYAELARNQQPPDAAIPPQP